MFHGHVGKGYLDEWVDGFVQASTSDADPLKREHPVMALDGADQWSCAPNSVAEVPATDELYDRRNDPFQLHNIIDQHPDVAKKLLLELTDFMDYLKES